MFVKARRRRGDGVAGEQLSRVARVFGGDDGHLAQHAQRPNSDVLEVADRCGDHEQRARHVGGKRRVYCNHWRIYGVGPRPFGSEKMIASEPLPHFVDDLLGYLHETHPTHATLDGVHTHDDLLEDVSRQAIDTETHALAGYLRRLDEINKDALTPLERLEHRMLTANLQSRMFELEAVRTWDKNPQFYSDLLASSLAGQTLFSHAPASERARRVLSKLRQTPRLIQAARDNIKDPPGIYVKVGIETMRGALKFIEDELPRAFKDVDDLHLLGDLADAQTEAAQAVGSVRPVPRGRSRAESARLLPAREKTASSRSSAWKRGCRCRSTGCSPSRRAS